MTTRRTTTRKTPPGKPTSAREAARLAAAYLQQLMAEAVDFKLEEVEQTTDGRFWLITLSYVDRSDTTFMARTKYKAFKVDARRGKVLSMKIREI